MNEELTQHQLDLVHSNMIQYVAKYIDLHKKESPSLVRLLGTLVDFRHAGKIYLDVTCSDLISNRIPVWIEIQVPTVTQDIMDCIQQEGLNRGWISFYEGGLRASSGDYRAACQKFVVIVYMALSLRRAGLDAKMTSDQNAHYIVEFLRKMNLGGVT